MKMNNFHAMLNAVVQKALRAVRVEAEWLLFRRSEALQRFADKGI